MFDQVKKDYINNEIAIMKKAIEDSKWHVDYHANGLEKHEVLLAAYEAKLKVLEDANV